MDKLEHTHNLKIHEMIYFLQRLGTTEEDYKSEYNRTYSLLLTHMLNKVGFNCKTAPFYLVEE
jgi:hypothetical protein